MRKGKPKKLRWPSPADEKPHERNWFRTLGSKKLKGEARKRKLNAALNCISSEPPHDH